MKERNRCFFILIALLVFSNLFSACSNLAPKYQLDIPGNLEITSITSEGAKVSWSAVTNAGYYEVMWTIKGRNAWQSLDVETNTIALDELCFDEEYSVQVRALPAADSKSYTASEFAKKDFKTLIDQTPQGQLARPANVKALFNDKKTEISISWDAVEGAAYYDISIECYDDVSPAARLKLINMVPASQTKFVYTGPFPGTKIFIKVAARDSNCADTCRWSREVLLEN